jgi:predicted ATPase
VYQPNYFIISGGPGSGKTTLIERLAARGFATVAETGRAILREQAESGGNAVHGGDAAAYGALMLERGVADYRRMLQAEEPVFFDRGIAELVGYFRLMNLPVPDDVRMATRQYRSNAVVFLAPPWREIYRQDELRKQDWQEAVRTFEFIRDAYGEAGYRPVELPRDSVDRRLRFMLAEVDAAEAAEEGR